VNGEKKENNESAREEGKEKNQEKGKELLEAGGDYKRLYAQVELALKQEARPLRALETGEEALRDALSRRLLPADPERHAYIIASAVPRFIDAIFSRRYPFLLHVYHRIRREREREREARLSACPQGSSKRAEAAREPFLPALHRACHSKRVLLSADQT
jgi:hypothetical protein